MSSYIYGTWQGGLAPSYVAYGQQNVAVGTHVGNYPHVVLATYSGTNYVIADRTYNLSYCHYQTASYVSYHGATYAATYYRNTACNVRSLEWI